MIPSSCCPPRPHDRPGPIRRRPPRPARATPPHGTRSAQQFGGGSTWNSTHSTETGTTPSDQPKHHLEAVVSRQILSAIPRDGPRMAECLAGASGFWCCAFSVEPDSVRHWRWTFGREGVAGLRAGKAAGPEPVTARATLSVVSEVLADDVVNRRGIRTPYSG